MKHILFILLIFIGFSGQSQNSCEACGTVNLDGSSFPSGLVYSWVCSDGQTASTRSATIPVTIDMNCVLTVTDTITGCVAVRTLDIIVCDTCVLNANVTLSGTLLISALTNCEGTASYQWQKLVSSTWSNIGTNSPTYNTGGVTGSYRVIAECAFGCIDTSSVYSYTFNCAVNVVLSGLITQTATVSGCQGAAITYLWQRESSPGIYTTVQMATTTSTTNTYTPTLAGDYKLTVTCLTCSTIGTFTYIPTPPCTANTVLTPGPTLNVCTYVPTNFNVAYTNTYPPIPGTPITHNWKVNGVSYQNNNYFVFTRNFITPGVYTLTVSSSRVGCPTVHDTTIVTAATCCGVTNVISPANITKCLNDSQEFTTSPSGGTAPYTYAWTSTYLGVQTSQGSGASKTLYFATVGTYTITCLVTDALGCSYTSSSIMNVTTCIDCTCLPTLALIGCNLRGSFTGGGCSGFSYQLQYSATGTGWSVVSSGIATGIINYTPTANGLYRLVITKAGCTGSESTIVNVTCYLAPCTLEPTLTLNGSSSNLCTLIPKTVTGNTFGGSATAVTLSENGSGTLNISSASSSPFSFTYTPGGGDLGNTVTITVTTNNPNGFPCIAVIRTYAINYLIVPTPVITSSGDGMCLGTTRTITYTPPGGDLTILSGTGILSGNVFTATSIGTVVLQYTVTNGPCSSSTTQSIVIPTPAPTFTVVTVAPATYLKFFNDGSAPLWIEDLVPACVPYDGYIMLGSSTTWDFTVTSTGPVTWAVTHYNGTLAPNLTTVSTSSTVIRMHVLGSYATCGCGAIAPVTPVCGITIVNAMARIKATDACGVVVFDNIFVKYANN